MFGFGTRNQGRGSQHRMLHWSMAPFGSMIPGAARYDARHCDTSGCRGFLQHVNDGAGGTTTLATCYRLDIVLESLGEFRMSLIRYVSRMFKQRGHKLADMEKQRRLHEQTTQGRLQLDLET